MGLEHPILLLLALLVGASAKGLGDPQVAPKVRLRVLQTLRSLMASLRQACMVGCGHFGE